MEERFTVQLDTSVHPDNIESLAERLGEAFLLTKEEAQALLSADSLVLRRAEALALVKMCRRAGVGVSVSAPLLTPAVRTQRWLKRYTLPVVFSLSSALALFALFMWLVPDGSSERVTENGLTRKGGVAALPWVESADSAADVSKDVAADGVADVIVVEPHSASSEITVLEPAATTDAAFVIRETEVPAAPPLFELIELVEPDLFSAARDLTGTQLEVVIERSPELEVRDAYGQTPLMYAAGSNTPESVASLIFAGANPHAVTNARWTPLMYAARNVAHPETVSVLLEAGADPSLTNSDGQTARDIALAHNHVAAVTMLEAALAQPEQPLSPREQVQVPPVTPAPSNPPGPPALVASQESRQSGTPPIDDSVLPIIDSAELGVNSSTTADPALSLFERQGANVDNDESRSVILDCLQDWANCADN